MSLDGLFPVGSRIVGLPDNENPRLLVMGDTVFKRWTESAFYPAYRTSAKAYRLLLRLKAALGIHSVRLAFSDTWLVRDFVQDIFPQISSMVILVGTSSPTQKLIIQVWDEHRVIGYLKFAQTEASRIRLEKEHEVLRTLPEGFGPRVIRFGEMGNGTGLLLTPVLGKALSARLPPHHMVWDFVRSLETSHILPIDVHPWLQKLQLYDGGCVASWVDRLSRRKWPITYQHGDLAPWNLFSSANNALVAIDWEHGTVEGFPYVDSIHYVLQISLLIYRLSPSKAKHLVMQYLTHRLSGFAHDEIEALVNLSVFSTFKQAEQDGHSEYSYYQAWRRAVWMDGN